MESSGGPFGPWDSLPPPPPPQPPNFAATFTPPDAFHHQHHHPSDLDFHPFHPFNGPPPDHFSGPPDHFNGPPDHFNGPPEHFNGPPDHFNGPPEHFNGPDHFNGPPDHFNGPSDNFNGPPDHFSGGGGFGGHPKPNFFRKRKFDHKPDNNGNFAKLYVGNVPRNITQEEVRHMFEEFGNVIEVVLLHDKKSGQQQEYCFVKYASVEDAERATMALHNQLAFPGLMAPLKVRFADKERPRLGLSHFGQHDSPLPRSGLVQHDVTTSGPVNGETEHKVYVNCLNREASQEEVKEIFSSYGNVVDIYIMRDEPKRSRGCGFVGFSHKYMAVAAINGLNGTYIMKGCDKPLIVRFAEPRKPKNGDSRAHLGDMQRNHFASALPMGSLPTCTNNNSTGIKAGSFCSVANQSCPASGEMQMFPVKPLSPSRLSQMSLQESQSLHMSSQICRQKDPKTQTSMQHDHQSPRAGRDVKLESPMLPSEPVSCGIPASESLEASLDCDWSEHISPDGEKYYFNCATYQSMWEKPEEFARYECQMLKQKLQNQSCNEFLSSTSEAPQSLQQIEVAKGQRTSDSGKTQLPGSCAAEHSQEQVQVETNSVGGQACVQ